MLIWTNSFSSAIADVSVFIVVYRVASRAMCRTSAQATLRNSPIVDGWSYASSLLCFKIYARGRAGLKFKMKYARCVVLSWMAAEGLTIALCLQLKELGIASGLCQELVVRTLFNDCSMLQDHDRIGHTHGGEAM